MTANTVGKVTAAASAARTRSAIKAGYDGADDTDRGIGAIVRDSWHRHLTPGNLAHTRLIREIEGLAAAGRLGDRVPKFLTERAAFVAIALTARGLDPDEALVKATFLNSAYAGLQTDLLTTGDRERIEAALEDLCTLADSWTAKPSA